ncbi:hypothetical protein TrCOL_g9352 [Triparma columacea]|uniref:Uncharacterized protein n=1 Tax=Triparma columacea TaxID=722753 RepID=A0A9W7GGG0_9STRA|nr:hypothetical protein TrCOL_g9352 [Triparma columacea]
MVESAELTERSLLLDKVVSTHSVDAMGQEKNLEYMDDIVDLKAIYSMKPNAALPGIYHVQDSEPAVCDASVGIRLKWEDDDDDGTMQRMKKRCPKEDVHCRAPFVKPRAARVKNVIELEDLKDLASDKNVCVTSLPIDTCSGHLPFISNFKYRSRFEAFRYEIFGVKQAEVKASGYIGVHLRRGDRCGMGYEKHRNVYKMGACGDIDKWIAKIGKKSRESDQLVYVATDSKEPNILRTIKDAGFFTKEDLFSSLAGGVLFDGKILTELDIFLIELDMLIYADTSFVVSDSNAISEVVATTRDWLGIGDVEVII